MAEQHLTLFQLNDTHAYLEQHPELFWSGGRAEYRPAGGLARVASLLNQARLENPGGVLAFDGGDTFHGTYPAVQSEGEALIPIWQALGMNGMTAHWDFAYGPARLQAIDAALDYPVLAINCFDEETGELVFRPYTVLEAGGLRVGAIGIAAVIVDKVMPERFSQGVRLSLGDRELPGWIDVLRREEKVDLVIVVSHLGFPQEVKLAREVEGMDVLLSSHTHNRIDRPALINQTIVIQSGSHSSFAGRLDLQVENGSICDFEHRLIEVSPDIEPDREVQSLVGDALAPHREMLSEVVGETATALNRNTVLEATMDNLLLQSLLDLTGAQLAFSNGWRYGAPVPPGPVTMNDLWNIIPVNPPVSTVELSGAELRAMLEENLEHTFSRDPYNQMGGYVKRCMGLNVYFRIENPPGQRICEIFVEDEPLRDETVYQAAFVTTQGVPAKYGHNRERLDTRAVETLQRYLRSHRPARAELRGTFVAI